MGEANDGINAERGDACEKVSVCSMMAHHDLLNLRQISTVTDPDLLLGTGLGVQLRTTAGTPYAFMAILSWECDRRRWEMASLKKQAAPSKNR